MKTILTLFLSALSLAAFSQTPGMMTISSRSSPLRSSINQTFTSPNFNLELQNVYGDNDLNGRADSVRMNADNIRILSQTGSGTVVEGITANGTLTRTSIVVADIVTRAELADSVTMLLDSIANISLTPGAPGENGTNGTNGTNGSIIYLGEGTPDSEFGLDSDVSVDTLTGYVYQKEELAWVLKGSFKGAKGLKGDKGDTGETGATGAAGMNATTTDTATTSANGLMSSTDKTKLDGIKRHVTYSGTTNGSGEIAVTFSTSFSVAPNIQVSCTNCNDVQRVRVTNISTTGFTVLGRSETLGLIFSNASGLNVDVLITEK